jgi:hypothetical protein
MGVVIGTNKQWISPCSEVRLLLKCPCTREEERSNPYRSHNTSLFNSENLLYCRNAINLYYACKSIIVSTA